MNTNTFSFSRMMMLFKKDYEENLKSYLWNIATMLGILLIAYLYFLHDAPERMTQDNLTRKGLSFLFWGLFIYGIISASAAMGNLKNKQSRLAIMMLPATPLEKYLYRWIFFTLIPLLSYILFAFAADYIRMFLFSIIYPDSAIVPINWGQIVANNGEWHLTQNFSYFAIFVSLYFFIQSLFVLGSSLWPRNSFFKTALAILALYVVFFHVFTATVSLTGFSGNVYFGGDFVKFLVLTLLILFTLFNWTLAYFRFKESEINN